MPPRRTIRKPTRWTPDEWAQVEAEARRRSVPPLRYVREAALGHPPQRKPTRVRDDLVHQLARVLNNMRQLQRVAELDGDDSAAARVEDAARAAEAAVRAVAVRPAADVAALLADLIGAGAALNALAHRANRDDELPPRAELAEALAAAETVFARIGA